jgi:hypothetical protein
MLACLWVTVALRETEVDNVDLSAFLIDPHQEIVRFHIAMQEVLRVHIFDSCYQLLPSHADSF